MDRPHPGRTSLLIKVPPVPGVAHRDLCPANVLVCADNTLKLADFGHSVYFRTGDPLCVDFSCGTPGYQPPELGLKAPYDPCVGDMWSLGAVLFFMTVGRLPYGKIKDEARLLRPLQFPEPQVLPLTEEVQDLLRGLLAYDPSARYTLDSLEHSPWMETVQNESNRVHPQQVYDGDGEQQLEPEDGF